MCITAEEYKALMAVSTEGLSLAKVTAVSVGELKGHVESLDDAIRGNGSIGLNTRVAVLEAITNVEQDHLDEKQAILFERAKEGITNARKSSIDWKWLAIMLAQVAIAGLYVAGK